MTIYQSTAYRVRLLFSSIASITASNPVLLQGEVWREKDATTGRATGRSKTGDGTVASNGTTITGTAFNDLPFDPQGAALSDDTPQSLGTAAAGTSTAGSRSDHRHALPSASQVGADATGTAAAAIAAHLATADPHPTYTTAAEAAAAAPVQSVSLSAPSGWSASSSNTAGSVTLTLALPTGYSLPSTASQANWDTAYSERARWDGGSVGLNAATGRTSLGLGSAAQAATSEFATAAQGALAATAVQPAALSGYQPLDSDLTAIAALSTTTFGRSLLTQGDAAAGRTALNLAMVASSGAYSDLSGQPTFANLFFDGAGAPVFYNLITGLANNGAGVVANDVSSNISSGTTPNYGSGLQTGTTAAGAGGLFLNPSLNDWYTSRGRNTLSVYSSFSITTLLRIPTLSDATETFVVYVGGYADFPSSFSARNFAGAQIIGNTINAAAIQAGVSTVSNSSVTYSANTWIKVRVDWNGTTVSVSINNGTSISISSGLPTVPLGYGVVLAKTNGTTNRRLDVANGSTYFLGRIPNS